MLAEYTIHIVSIGQSAMHTCMSHELIEWYEFLRERADDVGVESLPSVLDRSSEARSNSIPHSTRVQYSYSIHRRSDVARPNSLLH